LAPPRPYWKGYLKLSLVSCPIALYSAASSRERVAFRQIGKKTGNRLRQQLIDEVTREPIKPGEKGRGHEVGENQYVLIEDDELDAVTIESNHTIEIGTARDASADPGQGYRQRENERACKGCRAAA
jgi:DNA end-binding protein Ku